MTQCFIHGNKFGTVQRSTHQLLHQVRERDILLNLDPTVLTVQIIFRSLKRTHV